MSLGRARTPSGSQTAGLIARGAGYCPGMSENADQERIESRAELLPEERTAGSEDPQQQAEQILRESDERTEHPEETGEESTQTSTPDERPDGPA